MSNGKDVKNKSEKYQSRAKMLEKLMNQIYEQQENKETNKVFTFKN